MSRHKDRTKWRVDWLIEGFYRPGKMFSTKTEAKGYAEGKLKLHPGSAQGYKLVKEQ